MLNEELFRTWLLWWKVLRRKAREKIDNWVIWNHFAVVQRKFNHELLLLTWLFCWIYNECYWFKQNMGMIKVSTTATDQRMITVVYVNVRVFAGICRLYDAISLDNNAEFMRLYTLEIQDWFHEAYHNFSSQSSNSIYMLFTIEKCIHNALLLW